MEWLLPVFIGVLAIAVTIIGPESIRGWIKFCTTYVARIVRKAASYFRLYNRRALVSYILGEYEKNYSPDLWAKLTVNGEKYDYINQAYLSDKVDALQKSAMSEFLKIRHSKGYAFASILRYLGEKVPAKPVSRDDVECKIYRDHKDEVVLLTTEDLKTLFPEVEDLRSINMIDHGIEEYISKPKQKSMKLHWKGNKARFYTRGDLMMVGEVSLVKSHVYGHKIKITAGDFRLEDSSGLHPVDRGNVTLAKSRAEQLVKKHFPHSEPVLYS